MADQLSRLCRRGATKMPSYLLPSVKEAIAGDRPRALMTLAVAGWFRYLTAEDYAGEPIDVQDARSEEFIRLARENGADPRPLLTVREVFDSLPDDRAFVRDLHVTSEALGAGPRETIETWVRLRDGDQ